MGSEVNLNMSSHSAAQCHPGSPDETPSAPQAWNTCPQLSEISSTISISPGMTIKEIMLQTSYLQTVKADRFLLTFQLTFYNTV